MDQNRVLQVLPTLETGGAEKMVVHLASELTNVGLQTGVVSFFRPQGSQLHRALESAGVPVWSLGKHLGPDLAMVGRFRALIRRLQPNVIHTHLSTIRYAVPAIAGMANPPRIVHTIHRVAERDSERWLRWLQRWCMSRCVEVVAVSDEVAKSCARVYHQLNISVIPNGIPVSNSIYAPNARSAMRSSLGIDDGSFVFCCVARLRAIKNHKALLSAFARVRQQADAHLLLAGDGELRGELEGLARDLKIARQTHFLGERDDVASVLATSDAFVLSSFSEGTPFSLLEAMAAGLPVIATAVGGIPEIVRDGTEGLLVPPGSVDALYGAMARMISGADARVSMARAARQRAIQKFDARVMVQSYLTTYERHGTRTVLKTA